MSAQLEALTGEPPPDPDAQATVTDFLDYTEYLPSDLVRSLTLIGKLDEAYLDSTDEIHALTKAYGSLPSLPIAERPSAQALRQQISYHLDRAINARESAFAEAARLYDAVDRHSSRLTSISSKLKALPKPPSRDPTPAPQARSPQTTRGKPAIKGTEGAARITLHGPRPLASTAAAAQRARQRSRKVTVPGRSYHRQIPTLHLRLPTQNGNQHHHHHYLCPRLESGLPHAIARWEPSAFAPQTTESAQAKDASAASVTWAGRYKRP